MKTINSFVCLHRFPQIRKSVLCGIAAPTICVTVRSLVVTWYQVLLKVGWRHGDFVTFSDLNVGVRPEADACKAKPDTGFA